MHLRKTLTELISVEMIISVISATILQDMDVSGIQSAGFLAVLALFVFMWLMYFFNCRQKAALMYMLSPNGGIRKYLWICVYPLAIITAVAALFSCFDSEPLYTYLFLPFKLFAFTGLPKPLSAVICGAIFSVAAFVIYILFNLGEEETEDDT